MKYCMTLHAFTQPRLKCYVVNRHLYSPKGSLMIHCLRPIRKREKVGVQRRSVSQNDFDDYPFTYNFHWVHNNPTTLHTIAALPNPNNTMLLQNTLMINNSAYETPTLSDITIFNTARESNVQSGGYLKEKTLCLYQL
jgi:hypothetical protein